MKFWISRASIYEDEQPDVRPHPQAKPFEYTYNEDGEARLGMTWYIDIETLDELLLFVKETKEDAILTYFGRDACGLEIYDDYVE
jgi:hypothetical protein